MRKPSLLSRVAFSFALPPINGFICKINLDYITFPHWLYRVNDITTLQRVSTQRSCVLRIWERFCVDVSVRKERQCLFELGQPEHWEVRGVIRRSTLYNILRMAGCHAPKTDMIEKFDDLLFLNILPNPSKLVWLCHCWLSDEMQAPGFALNVPFYLNERLPGLGWRDSPLVAFCYVACA